MCAIKFDYFSKPLLKMSCRDSCHVLLQDQPNLRTRLDDAFLLRFLRARKFDYDRALQLLLNYHAGRKAWPEVFQDLKPSTVKHVLDLGFLTVLPLPDPNGRYILCLRPGNFNQQRLYTINFHIIIHDHFLCFGVGVLLLTGVHKTIAMTN